MTDVLEIAASQKGVSEHGGVSKYGQWLDAQVGMHLYYNLDWCGAFQLWCIAQGGADWTAAAGGLHREYAEVEVWRKWFARQGRLSHTPAKRRLVWYDWAGTPTGANHIGMVDHYDSSHIWAWEGNHNNQVELVRRPRDSQIMGYGEWWSHVSTDMGATDKLPVGAWMKKRWSADKGITDGTMLVQTTLTSGYGHSRAAHEGADTLLALAAQRQAAIGRLVDAVNASTAARADLAAVINQALADVTARVDTGGA